MLAFARSFHDFSRSTNVVSYFREQRPVAKLIPDATEFNGATSFPVSFLSEKCGSFKRTESKRNKKIILIERRINLNVT